MKFFMNAAKKNMKNQLLEPVSITHFSFKNGLKFKAESI